IEVRFGRRDLAENRVLRGRFRHTAVHPPARREAGRAGGSACQHNGRQEPSLPSSTHGAHAAPQSRIKGITETKRSAPITPQKTQDKKEESGQQWVNFVGWAESSRPTATS